MEVHIKNREKVLSELRRAYTSNLYRQSFNLDSAKCNIPETERALSPSVVDDILIEMYEKGLRDSEENDNRNCNRCKHFPTPPNNFSDTYENISNDSEEYEADLNFVQAIVWLKSSVLHRKDVSVEKFHVMFHKQWSDNRDTKNNCGNVQPVNDIQHHDRANLNSTLSNDNQADNVSSDNESECIRNFLCDVRYNEKHDLSQFRYQQEPEQNNTFTGEIRNLSTIASSQSYGRFCSTQNCSRNETILVNRIIPDSDEECLSSSDMFNDSSNIEENQQTLHEEGNILVENSMEKLLTSQSLLQNNFLEERYNLTSSNKHDSSGSDVTLFNGECSLNGQNSNYLRLSEHERVLQTNEQRNTQQLQTLHSNLHVKDLFASNEVDNVYSSQKDSDYDTCQLSGDYIYRRKNIKSISSQPIDIITSQKEDSAYDTYNLEFFVTNIPEKDWISEENQPSGLSFHRDNDKTVNQSTMNCSMRHDALPSSQNINFQKETSSIENTEYEGGDVKRRKLASMYGTNGAFKCNKKEGEKISSQWLRFKLDALDADDVAFQSVKVILLALQSEKMVSRYMRHNCWRNTLEEQAVNAVLSFCDVFEVENKTAVCTQEIVQAVTGTLDKAIKNTELNKVTILTHQLSIILELCNAANICIETINYLTVKLKSYESILIASMHDKKVDLHDIVNQLHVIFYALNICLHKYRLISVEKRYSENEREVIPSILDMWKKQLTFEGVIVEESAKIRERRWFMIFDGFTVNFLENITQFAEKSRLLINLLTFK